jgi:hypothetical protein
MTASEADRRDGGDPDVIRYGLPQHPIGSDDDREAEFRRYGVPQHEVGGDVRPAPEFSCWIPGEGLDVAFGFAASAWSRRLLSN